MIASITPSLMDVSSFQQLGAKSQSTCSPETLGPHDILCGRCKTAFQNVGNRRFRVMIQLNIHAYLACKTKTEKSKLIASIANSLRECGSRFLRLQKGGHYYEELNNREMLQKVGHALRDMTVAQQRSTMAEHARRQKQQQQEEEIKQYESDSNASTLDASNSDESSWTSGLETLLSGLSDDDSDDDEPFPLCMNF